MKKLVIVLFCILSSTSLFAQKYACVSSEYILSNMPEYKQAQKELNDMSLQWQKEVESKFQIVDKLYKSYQAESFLLPEELKSKKENEIVSAEKDAKDLQKQRFGNNGDLEKKRSELIKPIQDKVYNAIEKISQEKGYSIVFDKSAGATILYVDSKTDISDLVLIELGYKIKGGK